MATLKTIARHFGLSESTISRALNGKGHVSESTREAIQRYAEEVNYHPNIWAFNLKEQRSNTVGIVVPDISNEFYSLFFKEIDAYARRAGITPMLFNGNEDAARERSFLEYLHNSVLDGMVVATSGSTAYAELSPELLARIVFVDNMPDVEAPICFVGSNNIASSTHLTEHLVERGHRRIATIVGSLAESSAKERLEGFRQCLKKYRIELPPEWLHVTTFLYEDGYQAARELLTPDDRPTAVIAQNNVLAYATVRVCQELGLNVPQDVAIACFDHIDVYGFMRPTITSGVQSPAAMAAAATEELLKRMYSRPAAGSRILLEPEFRLGETT